MNWRSSGQSITNPLYRDFFAPESVLTPDGRRVRLKEDNTWEYMGNAPLTTKTQARTATTDITLQRAVIETHQEEIYKKKPMIVNLKTENKVMETKITVRVPLHTRLRPGQNQVVIAREVEIVAVAF